MVFEQLHYTTNREEISIFSNKKMPYSCGLWRFANAYIKKKVKGEMKKLFGDNAKYDLTYGGSYPDYVYRRTGDTVVYNASRITGRTYSMSVDKVIAYEQDKYRVIASACLVSQYNRENKGYVQKYTIYIDKDESAEYGYVVRKVKLYKKKDAKTD